MSAPDSWPRPQNRAQTRAGEDLPFADIPDPLRFSAHSSASAAVAARAEPGPTRSALRRRRGGLVLLVVVWLTAQLSWFGLRKDLAALPSSWWLGTVVVPVLGAAACYALALSGGRLGLGASRRVLLGVLLAGCLWLAAVFVALTSGSASLPASAAANARCLGLALLWSVVPAGLAWVVLARTFAAAALLRSALIGCGCGLLAASLVGLHCTRVALDHLLLGHALPVALCAAAAGVALARRARV